MSKEPPSEDVLRRAEEIYRRLAREHHWDFYTEPPRPEPAAPDARAGDEASQREPPAPRRGAEEREE